MFLAITWLALRTGVQVTGEDSDLIGLPAGQTQQTVIVQIAETVFGGMGWLVAAVSIITAIMLLLAATSAFNGFPLLGSVLGRDGYLPRQLHTRGDRLAYSNGIILLALGAAGLIVVFQASVSALIQLYIVGVFVAFTLSQVGMVRHWNRLLAGEPGSAAAKRMRRSRLVNSVGAVLTGSVLVIVVVSKFTRGAWIVVLLIPLLYLLMQAIKRHYDLVGAEMAVSGEDEKVTLPSRVHALVLVSQIHRPTLRAVSYARGARPTELEAITVNVDPAGTRRLVAEWEKRELPVQLRVLDSPYRDITKPVLEYVHGLRREGPRDLIAVYIPQLVVGHWWENLLHNQSALRLRTRLMFSKNVVVVTVPWQLQSSQEWRPGPDPTIPTAVRHGGTDSTDNAGSGDR